MRAVMCVVIAVCVSLLGCEFKKAGTAAGAKGIPDDWTHKELTSYLSSHGVKYRFITVSTGGGLLPPSGYYVPESSRMSEHDAHEEYKSRRPEVIFCQLKRTPQEAKDMAGTLSDAFAKGRFVFQGERGTLQQFEKSLP